MLAAAEEGLTIVSPRVILAALAAAALRETPVPLRAPTAPRIEVAAEGVVGLMVPPMAQAALAALESSLFPIHIEARDAALFITSCLRSHSYCLRACQCAAAFN